MKRAALLLPIGIALLLLLSGCWDIKSIQDTNYVTAVGYDYKDGRYIIYVQMLDFGNVAKQEGGNSGQSSGAVWSGHASGSTVMEAMHRLYQTSQQRVFWGQVSAVVLSERALQREFSEFMDGLIRFREMRYTQWVYGTKEPIDSILSTLPFFNQSPLGSILHQPEDNFRQRSYIRPVRLHRAVARYREPGASLLLPSLGISKDVWRSNQEPSPKLYANGIFAVSKSKPLAWVGEEDLAGLRWVRRETSRGNVTLKRDGKSLGSVMVEQPKYEVKYVSERDGKAGFSVRVVGKYVVSELLENIDNAEIENIAVQEVKSEIKRTFAYGVKNKLDLYQLENMLYRQAFPVWSRLTRNGTVQLGGLALDSIEVELKLIHSGMYKIEEERHKY